MKQNARDGNLNQLWEEMERRLVVMRYSKVTVSSYRQIFGWIRDYLAGYGETDYSKEAGQRFIAEYRLQTNHAPTLYQSAKTVVRRLGEILEDKMFAPCFREREIVCPPRFAELQENYLNHLKERGYSKSTIAGRELYTGRLLAWLPDTVESIDMLTAPILYDVFVKNDWPGTGYTAVRVFLAFLYEAGITKTDLSVCVPRPRRLRSLPSVYSGDEVGQLLSSVDCSNHVGKRDYAFLMLAAYLGLRSVDIVGLSFSDIDRTGKTIQVVQSKTGRPLTLVLNRDVEKSIDDYIKHGRPPSESDKIFLTSQAPYAPMTPGAGYVIVRKYMDIAGIAAQGRRRGPQALRQSYATALVTKGIPYSVVKEALGHEDPESAKHYVRVDVNRLRPCAITVPKPVGAFAVLLGDLEGVL